VISVTPEGSISPTQVLPPLVVRRATAPCPPAMHIELEGQATASTLLMPQNQATSARNWPRHFSGRQGRLVGRQARSPRSTPGRRQPPEPNGGPRRRRGSARRAVRGLFVAWAICPSLAGPGRVYVVAGRRHSLWFIRPRRRRCCLRMWRIGPMLRHAKAGARTGRDGRPCRSAYEPCGRSGPWASRGSRCSTALRSRAARGSGGPR